MKIYLDVENRACYIGGVELDPKASQKLYNHSPDGFMWGYAGSGPSQLALAILLELTDKTTALRYYQEFKREYIANLDQYSDWEFTTEYVKNWVAEKEAAEVENA